MSENYSTTKQALISAVIPPTTRTYKSIPHQQLIDLTLEGIQKAGFELGRERYTSVKEGNVANGMYTIPSVGDSEMQLQISWRNSYDKTLPLSFSIGTLILVCSNGLQRSMGMGSFKKKHQGEIQTYTPSAIAEYIKGAEEIFRQIQIERDRMKEISLTRTIQAEIIGRMFIEEDFVKSTQLNIIKRELEAPTHNYGDPNSLWSLYQYTTFAMREIHPSLHLKDHLSAHTFFVNAAGILVENDSSSIIVPSYNVEYNPAQLDLIEEIEKITTI